MFYRVLMQRTWRENATYEDVEGVIYHYPEQYFDLINGYERFVYYRPTAGAARDERSAYIGYGTLGRPFPDPSNPKRRFVDVLKHKSFPPVSYLDPGGRFYESRFTSRNAFQGHSIRTITEVDFARILAAAGVYGDPFDALDDTEAVVSLPYSPIAVAAIAPVQPLRIIEAIPAGTGYRPTGRAIDLNEAAALQERARKDHQETLRVLQSIVHQRGGTTYLNNNIDLLADIRGKKLLIEAKSVGAERVVVDRMRYGIGQLADYSIRYRSVLDDAQRVLAFGRVPSPASSWIGTILQESHVAFVALDAGPRIVPLNERARSLPLFGSA